MIMSITPRSFGQCPKPYMLKILRKALYTPIKEEKANYILRRHQLLLTSPQKYEPILPDRWHIWLIEVRDDIQSVDLTELELEWEIFADNSGEKTGKNSIKRY